MAVPYDDELLRTADGIVAGARKRQLRRVRFVRHAPRVVRLLALLVCVAGLSLGLSGSVSAPELIFFGLLGAFCVFSPESPPLVSTRANRTRWVGPDPEKLAEATARDRHRRGRR